MAATKPRNPAADAVDRYLANRASPVPGYTNATLAAAMEKSKAANPQATFGPSPNVAYPTSQQQADGTSAPVKPPPPPDWSQYLGMFGLPADVTKELDAIFARTPDINQATTLAIAYVRGTPWYAQTYPGIQEAIAKGIVRDERDYRSRMNDFAQVYRQYANREVRPDEYAVHLKEGVTVDTVARRFQGAALADTYSNEWQYTEGNFGEGRLTDEEKTAYGRQAAGLDSPLGLRVQRRLAMAQDRIRAAFSGTLATSRLTALSQTGSRPPDIGR